MSRRELILVEHALLVEEGPTALARASRPALDFEPLRGLVRRLLAQPWAADEERVAEVQARIEKLEARGAPPAVLEPQRRTLAALRGDGRDPGRVEGASPHDLRRWLVEHAVHERAGWDLAGGELLVWLGEAAGAGAAFAHAVRGAEAPPEVLRARPEDRYSPPAAVAAARGALEQVDPAGWEAQAPALAALPPEARPAGASGDAARDLAFARAQLALLRAVYARAGAGGQGVLVRLR